MSQMNANIRWPDGLRRTRPREQVMRILEQASRPLTALEIYTEFMAEKNAISQSTVYRTLETLVQHRVVLKDTMLDENQNVYELDRDEHKHYAICLGCRKVITLDICPIEESLERVQVDDFTVQGHKVEIYGYCGNCRLKQAASSEE